MPWELVWDRSNKNSSTCFSCQKHAICSSMYAPWLGICYWVFTWQIPEEFWNRILKLIKKVLRYLQGTKGPMVTYRRSDSLHMVGYSDSDYARVNAYLDVDFLSSRKGELFHGKAQSKLSLHRPQCMTVCSVLWGNGQVNWLKKFIPDLKVVDDIYRPLKLYCDYNLAVQYAHNISQVVLPNTLT